MSGRDNGPARRGAEWLAARLRNRNDEYPWQTIHWLYATLYLGGLPAAYFLLRDQPWMALAGLGLGFCFVVYLALLGWWFGV